VNRQGPGAVKPDLLWAGEAIIVAACNGVPVWLKDNLDYPEVWKEWPRC
jgi:hypothetical protein